MFEEKNITMTMEYKTLDEFFEEMKVERKTVRGKLRIHKARAKRAVESIIFSPLVLKHWFQRIGRGYSDSDAWNADAFLAGQISGILRWIVVNGHGVAMSYADEDMDQYNLDVERMVQARDKEYLYYAKIFAEYAKNGTAYDEDWQKRFGGVLESDIQEALHWLSKHFVELWD